MPITIFDSLRDDVKAHAKHFNDLESQIAKLDPHNVDNASALAKLNREAEESRRLFNVLGGAGAVNALPADLDAVPTISRSAVVQFANAINKKPVNQAPVPASPPQPFVSAADSLAKQAAIAKDAEVAKQKLADLHAAAAQSSLAPVTHAPTPTPAPALVPVVPPVATAPKPLTPTGHADDGL